MSQFTCVGAGATDRRPMALKTYAGGRLFGERHGVGNPTVLALHGWGRNRSDFSQALEGLDAVSLDLPGFGASPVPDAAWGAVEYAEAVGVVLDDMADPAVLVGHSFGGRVAVTLAARQPDRFDGLVLAGVPLLHRSDRAEPDLVYRVYRWLHRRGLIGDDRLEGQKRRRGSPDYRAATGIMRDVLVKAVNETYEEALASVACPVRMVWGSDDTEVPVSIAERACDLLSDASLDVVDGVGHQIPRAAPERLRAAIESLL